MTRGYMQFGRRKTIAKFGASAHPVKLVRDNAQYNAFDQTYWYEKHLESMQEAQVECMTGALYRYIIGAEQPQIRLSARDTVESEAVIFHSFRDIFEKDKPEENLTRYYDAWGTALRNDLSGLCRVLFSSIVFQENDLSANNFGLTYDIRGGQAQYGTFVKIDHGQSLNPIRIIEERAATGRGNASNLLAYAEIKCFPPSPTRRRRDRRKKTNRSKIRTAGRRNYELSYDFFDRIVMDFVDGAVDESYIRKLNYQPSTMPFYDARLLPMLDPISNDRGQIVATLEQHRYEALSMMALTRRGALQHLARCATDQHDLTAQTAQNLICTEVSSRILELRRALFPDPDWLRYCAENHRAIGQNIRTNWTRIINDPNERGLPRYRPAPAHPVASNLLQQARDRGRPLCNQNVIGTTYALIASLIERIESKRSWSLRGGGVNITTRHNQRRKVPATIASFHRHLRLASTNGGPLYRSVRAAMTALEAALATTKSSRSSDTTKFYNDLKSMILAYAHDLCQFMTPDQILVIHPSLRVRPQQVQNPGGKLGSFNPLFGR